MTTAMTEEPVAGLTDCDREPIHIPGLVQPFGFLVACDARNWTISHVSANALALAGDPRGLLGRYARDILGGDAFHELANGLSSSSGPELPGRLFGIQLANGVHYDASIHQNAGTIIVEFEPAPSPTRTATSIFVVRSMLARMQQAQGIDDICAIAVSQLRLLIDFDRVMIYRFLQDGSGSVIAESKAEGVASYLGHHYPASDIPQQARQLYLRSWLRMISDVHSTPVPLLSADGDVSRLDMSFCALRSVSPIHIQYLKNMGVAASLSISIVVGGALWGLIACHNTVPRLVPADTRLAAEFFGQAFSLQLQTLARADVAEMLRDARQHIDRIVSELPPGEPLWLSLGSRLGDLQQVLDCDGAALWFDGRAVTSGDCPPQSDVPLIAAALGATGESAVFATNQLSLVHPPALDYAERASGLMAVPLSRTPGDYLLLFRREFIRTIDWAGNPDKPVDWDSQSMMLSPRKSFELWREEVKNQSRIWEPHDRLTGEALRIALLEIVLKYNEIVSEERARAERQHRLQTAEFNHRVKNALALIGALVAQSKGRHNDMRAFVVDLEGRIRSLAIAHDMASTPGALELGELLAIELRPYDDEAAARVSLSGPSVWLKEDASPVIALVVHELATNASKHGALSVPAGRVAVRWWLDDSGGCHIEWRETGGAPVRPPSESGFGTLLIGRQIPFELGGRSDVRYPRHGLEVDLWIPAAVVSRISEKPSTVPPRSRPAVETGQLAGRQVLLVEDSLIVALEIERRLRKLGARDVLVAGTVEQALAIAQRMAFDVAVLDVNLKGATSYAVAEALARRGVPFIFSTGYGADFVRPEGFANVPLVAKPYSDTELADALCRVMDRA